MNPKAKGLLGLALTFIGILMFFINIRVGGFMFGRSSKAGLIFLIMGIDFVIYIVKKEKVYLYILFVLMLLLLIMVILNLRIYLASMSLFKYMLIAGCTFGGIGLFISAKKEY